MFRSILVATDGSAFSEKAVAGAAGLARSLGAQLMVLTVTSPFEVMDAYRDRIMDVSAAMRKHERAEAHHSTAALDSAVAVVHGAGVTCDTLAVEHDHPWEAIIRTARERGCDLIVMASHGRRGLEALLVGSETQKVLTHSGIPVLVYR